MGATYRSRWGGRWTAVNSLWTYTHRLLHLLNISSTDTEELALLSGPLVRLRHSSHVLSHDLTPLHPEEPLGFVHSRTAELSHTLFFLHLDTSDAQRPDRMRLATAYATETSPRAWLAVDHKTGIISLTSSEMHAAVFEMRQTGAEGVALYCSCSAGSYLSRHGTSRARICATQVGKTETFALNVIALPPTLERDPPLDCTLAAAYFAERTSRVRIQNERWGWFLVSKPGDGVRGGGGDGWDGFTLEYDSPTRSVRILDCRGLYLKFGEGGGVVGGEGRGERFEIEFVGGGDGVVLRSRKGYLSGRRGGKVCLEQECVAGKREIWVIRMALPSMVDLSRARVLVRGRSEGRLVEGSVIVPVGVDIVFGVIRDYNGFHGFIDDASESRILDWGEREGRVEMVQCHSFLMLRVGIRMFLKVREDWEEGKVFMELERGWGVKEYKGVWQAVEREDGRCLLRCSLLAQTTVPAPGVLLDGLMSHATRNTMEQIRAESIRRSAAGWEGDQSSESKRKDDQQPEQEVQ